MSELTISVLETLVETLLMYCSLPLSFKFKVFNAGNQIEYFSAKLS